MRNIGDGKSIAPDFIIWEMPSLIQYTNMGNLEPDMLKWIQRNITTAGSAGYLQGQCHEKSVAFYHSRCCF